MVKKLIVVYTLCSGSKRDIVINAHGSTAKYVALDSLVNSLILA